jgi:TatD DNase family protein
MKIEMHFFHFSLFTFHFSLFAFHFFHFSLKKMQLIDTHAHLYSEEFNEDRVEMIQRALEAGVTRMYLPNIDSTSIEGMLELEAQYPGQCLAMMGLHPCYVKENYQEELALVKSWLEKRSFPAIGEIGIDLYWDKTHVKEQEEAFLTQVEWAKQYDLPIVIHSRESMDMILELLQPVRHPRLRGIFHCFSGSVQQAEAAIEMGFLLGIGGVLTFKKSGLDAVLSEIALQHLVLETDAPYLAPTPFRGKRNESSYVLKVAEKLAEVKGVSLNEVAEVTTQNALQLFGTL